METIAVVALSGYRFRQYEGCGARRAGPRGLGACLSGCEFGGSVYTVIVPDACLRCLDPAGVLRLRAEHQHGHGRGGSRGRSRLVVSVASLETDQESVEEP
jgi:hypothetical protein